MGLWPFGGSKRNKAKSEEKYREIGYESRSTPTPDNMARNEKEARGPAERPSRTNSRRPQSEQSKPLPKMFANERANSTRATSSRHQAGSPTLEPPNRARTDAHDSRSSTRQTGIYQQDVRSDSSLGPENFSAVRPIPTLRAKRSDYNPALPRRKSSKRKAEDQAREREVRNMSSPIPIPKRPATYSEGLLARESKKMPGGLNYKFERPMSDISLPLPESLSEAETRSPANSFKVSAFAMLTPRPTVRYDTNPRSPAPSRAQLHSRLSVQQAVVEEDLSSSHKRIDDLADNLDSSGLRELMERDRKRRERKREDEKTKLQRKLQRRADRQKEEEARRVQSDEAGPSTPSRRAGRGDQDILTSPVFPSSPPTTGDDGGDTEMHESSPPSYRAEILATNTSDPFADSAAKVEDTKESIRNPFEDENDGGDAEDPFAHPADGEHSTEPTLPVRSPLRQPQVQDSSPSAKVPSPPTSPLQTAPDRQALPQASQLERNTTPEVSENLRQDRRNQSDQIVQPVSSWANFFRRGKRQPSVTDRTSEFTNTSRESFSRQHPPPIVPPRDYRRSATPQRTQSKFREDLPELPLSPPDSRVQSPDVEGLHQVATPPVSDARRASQSASGVSDGRSLATSASLPVLDRPRQEQHLSQQRSVDLQAAEVGSPGPAVPQSLASVDSEASWLSGKPVNRGSGQMGHPLRQSQSSLRPLAPGAYGDDEGEGVADDEFLSRLTPAPEETRRDSSGSAIRKASSTVIDLREEQERSPEPEVPPLPSDLQDEKWHGSVGRQPTVIKQPRAQKSKEGLLKDTDNDDLDTEDDADSADTGDADVEYHNSPIMRATSVEYRKGHSRVVSAGSARLLDIRRASVQSENKPPGERTSGVPRGSSTMLQEKEAP